MFEDIISDDEFENPGASNLTYFKLELDGYLIEVHFTRQIVEVSGDYDMWTLAEDFYEVDQKLGDDSPFTDIDLESGIVKLQDGWQFQLP